MLMQVAPNGDQLIGHQAGLLDAPLGGCVQNGCFRNTLRLVQNKNFVYFSLHFFSLYFNRARQLNKYGIERL